MDNNTNQNVDTNVEKVESLTPSEPVATQEVTPEVKPVETAQPAPAEEQSAPVAPPQQETPKVETPVPVQAPAEEPKEEIKQEPVKKEKPLKMKKQKGIVGTVFLLLILLGLIVLLTMIVLDLDKLYNQPKGVTDLNNIVIEEKEDVLYDSKLALNNLNSNVKDAIIVYLTKNSDTNFKDFINTLPNSTKLYLATLNGRSSVTLITLKSEIKEIFGFDVTLEGEEVLADDNKTVLYKYDDKTGMFIRNEEAKDLVYTPFKVEGEFLPMEYDDPTGTLEDSEVIVYGMVVVQTKKGNKFLNNKFTFIEDLSFDELKEKLPTLYGDQKENFDVVRYSLTKKDNKYIVNNIKLN